MAIDDLLAAVRVNLRAGVRLYVRGTLGTAIYVLQSGIVKETVPGPEGEECIVRLVMPQGVTGLCALLGVPHAHSAQVIHAGVACRIPVACMVKMRAENPAVVDSLLMGWQQAIDDADRIVANLCHGSGRSRMARALLHLRSALMPGEPLQLRRTDLASLLAIAPESVARLLSEFRRDGLFQERQRRCVGIDVERLTTIAKGLA